ncbi:hypothetical protein ACNKHM_25625 [Shigella sonnei]
MPCHHPARADHDTFWFDATRLLRTRDLWRIVPHHESPAATDSYHCSGRVYATTTTRSHPTFIRWKG